MKRGSLKLMTDEELVELAAIGDREAADFLFEHRYKSICKHEANDYKMALYDLETLEMHCHASLMKSIKRFNPRRGVLFSTFAKRNMRNALIDLTRNERRRIVPTHLCHYSEAGEADFEDIEDRHGDADAAFETVDMSAEIAARLSAEVRFFLRGIESDASGEAVAKSVRQFAAEQASQGVLTSFPEALDSLIGTGSQTRLFVIPGEESGDETDQKAWQESFIERLVEVAISLIELRTAHGYSIEEVAEIVGFEVRLVSALLRIVRKSCGPEDEAPKPEAKPAEQLPINVGLFQEAA